MGINNFYIMSTVLQLNGICLAFVRLIEPYVWQTFKAEVVRLLNIETKKTKVKFEAESLDSFLNSAMNIEFVYLILLGISCSVEVESLNDIKNEIQIINNSKETRVIFKNFRMKDKDWNVGSFMNLETSVLNPSKAFFSIEASMK